MRISGGGRGASAPWDPSMDAGVFGWLDFTDATKIGIVSGGVDTIVDSLGNGVTLQATASARRGVYTTGGSGGASYLRVSNATDTRIVTTQGVTIGPWAHSIGALVKFLGDKNQIGGVLSVGQFGGVQSNLGMYGDGSTPRLYGGTNTIASPATAIDNGLHYCEMTCDATGLRTLYIDGQPAGTTDQTLVTTAQGWGVMGYNVNAGHVNDAELYQAIMRIGIAGRGSNAGAKSSAWREQEFIARKNSAAIRPTWIAGVGDSMIHGQIGGSSVMDYLLLRLADRARTVEVGNFGAPGETTAQILSGIPALGNVFLTGLQRYRAAVICAGINDRNTNVPASTIITNLDAIVQNQRDAGVQTLVVCTSQKTVNDVGAVDTTRLDVNAHVLGMRGVIVVDLATLVAAYDPNTDTLVYSDKTHFTPYGYNLWATAISDALYTYLPA